MFYTTFPKTIKKTQSVYWTFCVVTLLTAFGVGGAVADIGEPVLYFSDITSGPRTGNTDNSFGQIPGQDGTIVTIWGRNFGSGPGAATVYCNGVEAASYYFWGDATQPANLYTYHQMQIISFQISHLAQDGPGEIYVVADGRRSNSLPFTVRRGNVYFVKTTGNNDSGNGSWSRPWQTIIKATNTIAPGDIAYIRDGVHQTTETDFEACVNLGSDGTEGNPKALVVYPGARSEVGNANIPRAFHFFNTDNGMYSVHWVIAKFTVTTREVGIPVNTGFRVIGNHVTAPNGDGLDGAIGGIGNNVSVLGNELENVGGLNSGKLYHAIYLSGVRQDDPPRAPTEANREIAWNYIHDCKANRAIDIYSEQEYAAYIERHAIHHNVIVNQHGDGILLGYYTTGENWIYNNLIINAGLGPEWPDDVSSHSGIRIDSGHETVSKTVVHCYNNTIYGSGWSGTVFPGESGHLFINQGALDRSTTINFVNNIVYSTGEPYIASDSGSLPPGEYRNCWYGNGVPPAWERNAIHADPVFVNVAANDFLLQPGSPCIDVGRNLAPVVQRDLLGVLRPQGTAYDLGAYEYEGEGGEPPTPLAAPILVSPPDAATVETLTPTLQWQASANATSYGVQIASDSGFANLLVNQTGITVISYAVPSGKLADGKTYYWHVNVANATGTSDWTTARSLTISSGPKPPSVETTVKLSPEAQKVSLKTDVKVSIRIEKVVALAGFQLNVKFNPNNLQVQAPEGIREGAFLKSDGGQTFWNEPIIDNTNGTIHIAGARITQGGVDGEGELAQIAFTSRAVGESTVEMTNVKLSDVNGQPISAKVLSGKITIQSIPGDVNQDGKVDILDLVLVGQNFGKPQPDVNNDGIVDIFDLVIVGQHFGESAESATPPLAFLNLSQDSVDSSYLPLWQKLYAELLAHRDPSEAFIKTRLLLQALMRLSGGNKVPEANQIFQNYPNPFNPETWIPYQLAFDAGVKILIYDIRGALVRRLELGHQQAGYYVSRESAAHWDGRSDTGEWVSSGTYFYHLRAGDFHATKKMVIVK